MRGRVSAAAVAAAAALLSALDVSLWGSQRVGAAALLLLCAASALLCAYALTARYERCVCVSGLTQHSAQSLQT